MNNLEYVFNPNSIAIAGVSRNENTIGRVLLRNLINYGFKGQIYPIHPKINEMDGLTVYSRLTDISDDVDLLISIISRKYIMELVDDGILKGIKAMIIITAGFKEKDDEGAKLEQQILEKTKKAGIRVIGPNSMGIFNAFGQQVNANFSPNVPKAGNISFISQSGAIGAVLMGYARELGVGLSKFVSVGNKMDVNINHLLPYLKNDNETHLITSYMESFSDPKHFITVARETALEKPIIMVKSGSTSRGSTAAASHTGALASADNLVDSVLRRAGVVRVESIRDLIDTSMMFLRAPLPKGRNVAVVSNAGGPGTMATDSLIKNGLTVNDLSDNTYERLRAILPLEASIANPIDILPSAGIQGYKDTVEIVLDDDGIDIVFVLFLPPVVATIDEELGIIDEVAKNSEKPVIVCYIGDHGDIERNPHLSYPVYPYPEKAVQVLRYFCEYAEWKQKIEIDDGLLIEQKIIDDVDLIITTAQSRDNLLVQHEIEKIFSLYGFNLPEAAIIYSLEDLEASCKLISFPIVLKIASKHISHKSDSGGVIINIQTLDEARQAYDTIQEIYNTHKVPNEDRQMLIQKYYSDGVEIALGATYDPQFGHFVMVGTGGVLIELLNDVKFEPVPVNISIAKEMLFSLKGIKLLQGFRGKKAVNIEMLLDNIVRISKLVENHPRIAELDINPLFVLEDRTVTIDARMSLRS
ncbi:MAG: acetate--CoA ligase family protein [Candidatus Heimdallarchaeota archaeon]|nr:acetate--CoA ligase family protein [Candidatus Heimdallarchaeota archaeon]